MQGLVTNSAVKGPSRALDLAINHFEHGNFYAAVTVCQQILQNEPNNHSAMTLLGTLTFYSGRSDVAVQLLERSIALQPKQSDAYNNLGEICRSMGNFQRALACFDQELRQNPCHIGALINYANALQDVYQYNQAIEIYQRALAIKPDHTGALSNLANVFQQLYQHEAAIETFSRLLEIAPEFDWARGGRMYSRIHCCDWADYQDEVSEIAKLVAADKRAIKVFELRPLSDSPALELKCASIFAQAMYPAESRQCDEKSAATGKIRVAYLSADFRQHPVSQLLVEVLERHDGAVFEVIGISFGPDDQSPIRERITRAFDQFVDVRQRSDQQVAELLQSLGVQIAVDLMGYTTHARPDIFARRAAPIQISYLGYAGTSGASNIDYIIADDVIIPEKHQPYYSETVLRLPSPLLPRDNKVWSGKVPSRAEEGLPENGFVYCAFNNHYKITPIVFAVWMRLLNATAGSVLWLSDANDVVKTNLRNAAESSDVSSSRIIFAERTPHLEDHLARHALADLFLDTFPYNAHTTASDALWVGLPVLTRMGETFSARVAASLLHSLDLPELITESLEHYEALALQLSSDRERLATLKAKLSKNKAALHVFDSKCYAENLEQLFLEAVACSGNNTAR